MKKIRLFSLLAASMMAVGAGAGCFSYAKHMNKAVASALGPMFQSYTWISYPTTNFGVGTVFKTDPSNAKFDASTFYCDVYSCFGIKALDDTGNIDLTVAGMATVGKNGPAITLSETQRTEVATELVLPKIAEALQIGAEFDHNSTKTTKLTISEVYPRYINRKPFKDKLLASSDEDLKAAFNQGRLGVVLADIVIKSMSVSICIDTKTGAALNAKLGENVGKVIGDPAKLQVSVKSSTQGCYTLESTRPVIIAYYVKRQPSGGTLDTDIDQCMATPGHELDCFRDWAEFQK